MASKSLSEQLAELTNPVPTSFDPEDDIYEETRAQVTGWEAEPALSGDEEAAPSRLRQRTAALLPDLDPRYVGRAVSRKSLQQASDGEDSLDDSELSEEDGDAPEGEEDQEEPATEDDEDGEDEDQLEAFRAKLSGVEAGTNGLSTDDGEPETDSEEAAGTGGDSEDPDTDVAQEDSDGEGEDSEDGEEEEGEDISAALDSQEEAEGGVELTSQQTGSDAQKGAAVKAQLSVWDQLLECRIKVQPCLQLSAQLPAPGDSWRGFWPAAGEQTEQLLQEARAAADRLLRQLTQLQDLLTEQFPETRKLSGADTTNPEPDTDSDSDSNSADEPTPTPTPTRKRRRSDLTSADPAKRFAAYRPYRDQTIQRWNDKTRLTGGKAAAKSFAAFEQSTLKQIEQILTDRERLLRRTRLRRSDVKRLGQPADTEPEAGPADERREYDSELFDDSDFYHQLLRELIERKTVDVTDPLALGRQWIQIQKLRSKLKKKVDTRASKGRKVRYEVYPKLVNFMASERAGAMADSARDELFRSLFGSRTRPADSGAAASWSGLNGDGAAWAEVNGGLTV